MTPLQRQILSRLSEGPQYVDALRGRTPYREFHRAFAKLIAGGLVVLAGRHGYELTAAGRAQIEKAAA